MALRVLLADESTTIRKVMQLALQDFAVEVKSVHAGVDVLDVAKTFQPDIIFADVLLQKKNGYEVCAALKADAELKTIPVVLMWSSFMDLDDLQARSTGSDARLEKPFDVETLRKLVLELVPKTRSQRLSHFLEFSPKLNAEMAKESAAQTASKNASESAAQISVESHAPAPPPPSAAAASSGWTMESFDDPTSFETFRPLELSEFAPASNSPSHDGPITHADPPEELRLDSDTAGDDEAWSRQDLSQFKLDLPSISVGDHGDEQFKIPMGEDEFTQTNDLLFQPLEIESTTEEVAMPIAPLADDESHFEIEMPPPEKLPDQDWPEHRRVTSTAQPPPGAAQMSSEELEHIIRAQSREIIEQVVRKLVPDLAATIIREELEKLLEETAVREAPGHASGKPTGKDKRL